MSTSVASAEALRHHLVDDLAKRGYLSTQPWLEAFRVVPREAFVRRFRIASPTGDGPLQDLADAAGQDAALEAVYLDASLLTQHDSGGTATSSSTAPSLMALMLEALLVEDGMSVLEIGTGTGYNAALLAHRLGSERVVTVDLDQDLVDHATRALHSAGYEPTTVCGDGAEGFAPRAPYDRLIATCAVPRVPAAWLWQVRPGGLILVNVGFGLVRLTVAPDGSARGEFLDYAAFMSIRSSLEDVATTAQDVLALASGTGSRRTAVLPETLGVREVEFLRSVMMPGVKQVVKSHPDGSEYLLADPASGSWARARDQRDGSATVTESGPRNLWQELVLIAEDWQEAGRPPISAYSLTVTTDGGHELHVAGSEHHWLM